VIANYVRDPKSAETLSSEAAEEGLRIDLCRADLTSPKGMDQIVEHVQGRFATLSIYGALRCHRRSRGPSNTLTLRHFDWTFPEHEGFFDLVLEAGAALRCPKGPVCLRSPQTARRGPSRNTRWWAQIQGRPGSHGAPPSGLKLAAAGIE